MTVDPIPSDVATFILDKVDSVAYLEALILLRVNGRRWSVEELAERLYISAGETAEITSRLCADGLIAQERVTPEASEPARYNFAPASQSLAELIDRLCESYSQHLVPVTNLIHSKQRSRVQQFADAFKFRKDS
jgi:hypothetical protein